MCENDVRSEMPDTTHFIKDFVRAEEREQQFHLEDAVFCIRIGHQCFISFEVV